MTGEGSTAGEPAALACDLIVTSVGVAPLGQLACGVGARFAYDDELASFRVEGVPAGVHLAGVGQPAPRPRRRARRRRRRWCRRHRRKFADAVGEPECRSHPWPIFPHPSGKDFVDFDEDQTVADLLNAIADGFDDPELAKRYTTTAMGPSQGRHSALNALRIVRRDEPARRRRRSASPPPSARPSCPRASAIWPAAASSLPASPPCTTSIWRWARG